MQVKESGAAHIAYSHDAAGQRQLLGVGEGAVVPFHRLEPGGGLGVITVAAVSRRVGVDAPAADALQLGFAVGDERVLHRRRRTGGIPVRRNPYSMAMISSLILPDGALTSAMSPTFLPKRLLPMGETLEILPCAGSDSALPVMV